MNYLQSTHSGQMIEVGKYIYHFKSLNADGTKYWRCKNYRNKIKCPATLTTRDEQVVVQKNNHKSESECLCCDAKIAMIKCNHSIKKGAKTSTSSMKKMFDKKVNEAIKESGLETKDFANDQLDFYGLKKPCINIGD